MMWCRDCPGMMTFVRHDKDGYVVPQTRWHSEEVIGHYLCGGCGFGRCEACR